MWGWRKRWTACLMACLIAAGTMGSGTVKSAAAEQTKDEEERQYNLSELKVSGYPNWQIANAVTDEFAPVYEPSYHTNDRMVKLQVKDSGMLNVEITPWSDEKAVSVAAVYDGSKKFITNTWKDGDRQIYRKTYVKEGDIFYVKLPQSKKSYTIKAAVLYNAKKIKSGPDETTILGEGGKCYTTFQLRKKSIVTFAYGCLIPDAGNVSAYVQKKTGTKWKRTGAKMKLAFSGKEFTYGLRKGKYRLVFQMPKTQALIFDYDTQGSFYNGKYGIKKSSAKDLKKVEGYKAYMADQMFTDKTEKARWYRYKKKAKKKQELYLYSAGNSGKVKFTIYRRGRKKTWKKISLHNASKKYKLPKGKGTYYIKVSKSSKKMNGSYEMIAE